ncbi:MAG: RES domain-containing protein [Candidatus Dormibacteraceae bacterium]
MLVYRVFPHQRSAAAGEPGHPDYLSKPQGKGRLDNPRHYDTWYFALTPEAAVGEVFGDLTLWADDMFEFPALAGARRALGVFELPDDVSLLDLDDARALLDRGLRPTQVIARNRAATQGWALGIFNERDDLGGQRWAGVRWWSYHRPHWTVVGLWQVPGVPRLHQIGRVEGLDVDHPAILDAARTLGKTIARFR